MPEQIDWVLYHTKASGTNASAELTFFDDSESNSGLQVTNMEVRGQLPSSQRFTIDKIKVLLDVEAATGDVKDLLDSAVLELNVNNRRMLIAPLIEFCGGVNLNPETTASTTDDARTIGPEFELKKPLQIPGGVPFNVKITIGKTAPSASSDITVMLKGILERP